MSQADVPCQEMTVLPEMHDDRALDTERTPGAATRLLEVVTGMLHELRPTAPLPTVRLGDSIERDLGLDSLSRVELVSRVERAFGVRLPERLVASAHTPRDLLDAILRSEGAPVAAPLTRASAVPAPPLVGSPADARTIVDACRWHLERHREREHIRLLDGDETREIMSY